MGTVNQLLHHPDRPTKDSALRTLGAHISFLVTDPASKNLFPSLGKSVLTDPQPLEEHLPIRDIRVSFRTLQSLVGHLTYQAVLEFWINSDAGRIVARGSKDWAKTT